MKQPRSAARLAGALYLTTHVTSVAAVILYGGAPTELTSSLGDRTAVLTGGLLEVLLAASVVGTSVALYPLLRPHGTGLATAHVALRTLEASVILTGVVALLPVVAGPSTVSTPVLGSGVAEGLQLVHAWTFLVGPGLICPINTVVLALLLLRRGLVPRVIPVIGLVGGPLVGVANLAVMYGQSSPQPLAALPIFTWEVSLALYLIVRGLRPSSTSADRIAVAAAAA